MLTVEMLQSTKIPGLTQTTNLTKIIKYSFLQVFIFQIKLFSILPQQLIFRATLPICNRTAEKEKNLEVAMV